MRLALSLPELDALACARCGGAVELTALAAEVECGHCRHRQPLAADVRARLSAYHAAVEAQLPAIVASLDDADLFVHRHAGETKMNAAVAGCGVLALLVWCVAPTGYFVSESPTAKDAFGIGFFAVPLLALPLVAVVRVFTRDSTRAAKRYRVTLPDFPARCSACGGENAMPGGRATTSCAYCRAPLVATPAKIAAVLDDVRGFRHAAALRKWATLRDTQGPRANAPLAYRGNREWYARTTAAVYAAPAWAPLRAWLEAVARRTGGAYLEGDAAIAWLDARWAGAHPITGAYWGHPHGAVVAPIDGREARIELWRAPGLAGQPATGAPELVLLCATEPPDPASPPPAGLRARGFEPVASEGGLCARATPATTARLLASPDPMRELGAALHELAAHARGLGLGPPPAPRPLPDPG